MSVRFPDEATKVAAGKALASMTEGAGWKWVSAWLEDEVTAFQARLMDVDAEPANLRLIGEAQARIRAMNDIRDFVFNTIKQSNDAERSRVARREREASILQGTGHGQV